MGRRHRSTANAFTAALLALALAANGYPLQPTNELAGESEPTNELVGESKPTNAPV